jgi:predicted SAM-dependent methyltransferase
MYWLEIAMPDGELMIWEYMDAQQMMFLRNMYMQQNLPVRSGKHEEKVDNVA